jgi:hypothetical protein
MYTHLLFLPLYPIPSREIQSYTHSGYDNRLLPSPVTIQTQTDTKTAFKSKREEIYVTISLRSNYFRPPKYAITRSVLYATPPAAPPFPHVVCKSPKPQANSSLDLEGWLSLICAPPSCHPSPPAPAQARRYPT